MCIFSLAAVLVILYSADSSDSLSSCYHYPSSDSCYSFTLILMTYYVLLTHIMITMIITLSLFI